MKGAVVDPEQEEASSVVDDDELLPQHQEEELPEDDELHDDLLLEDAVRLPAAHSHANGRAKAHHVPNGRHAHRRPPRPSHSVGRRRRRPEADGGGDERHWGHASTPSISLTLKDILGGDRAATAVGQVHKVHGGGVAELEDANAGTSKSAHGRVGSNGPDAEGSVVRAENQRARLRTHKMERGKRQNNVKNSLAHFLTQNESDSETDFDEEHDEDESLISEEEGETPLNDAAAKGADDQDDHSQSSRKSHSRRSRSAKSRNGRAGSGKGGRHRARDDRSVGSRSNSRKRHAVRRRPHADADDNASTAGGGNNSKRGSRRGIRRYKDGDDGTVVSSTAGMRRQGEGVHRTLRSSAGRPASTGNQNLSDSEIGTPGRQRRATRRYHHNSSDDDTGDELASKGQHSVAGTSEDVSKTPQGTRRRVKNHTGSYEKPQTERGVSSRSDLKRRSSKRDLVKNDDSGAERGTSDGARAPNRGQSRERDQRDRNSAARSKSTGAARRQRHGHKQDSDDRSVGSRGKGHRRTKHSKKAADSLKDRPASRQTSDASLSNHIEASATSIPTRKSREDGDASEESSSKPFQQNFQESLLQFDPTNENHVTTVDQTKATVSTYSEKFKNADGTESELQIRAIAGLPTFEDQSKFHESLGSFSAEDALKPSARQEDTDDRGSNGSDSSSSLPCIPPRKPSSKASLGLGDSRSSMASSLGHGEQPSGQRSGEVLAPTHVDDGKKQVNSEDSRKAHVGRGATPSFFRRRNRGADSSSSDLGQSKSFFGRFKKSRDDDEPRSNFHQALEDDESEH